ncbi:MAG: family 1 glycosylhydrolase [Candidatus Levybacteria bacterium]|nr:family 1 glycosylhydrolase [Candidatus Levybacteria bacterium]
MYQLQYFNFPSNFKFGVADADLQVIGEQYTLKNENSEPTMWTHFAKSSPRVYQNQTPLEGIDRYHRWKEDIILMKELGIKDYRTSISMARIMTQDKTPNKKALEWYKKYFAELQKNGIKIYATLYHWELPQYLSKKGGWKNRETTLYLVEHAKIVHKYLGEFIDEYFILNEPYQATFESYHLGVHAPGEKDLKGALAAVHHILLAQGMVFRALKNEDKNIKLSTAFNTTISYAASSSPEDIKAAQYQFGYQTGMFTDPLYLGRYPEYMAELFGNKMPKIEKNDMEIIKVGSNLHAFGINFYRGRIVRYDGEKDIKFSEVRYPQGVTNGLGWPVSIPPTYPEAFYDLLCELYHKYENFGMKQIYITENGTCWDDKVDKKGKVDDEFRIYYVHKHLRQVQKAILAGIPVKAYFLWTLMDNYEWDLGHKPGSNFGLIHIDRETLKRTPKKSYYWYKDIIERKMLL